MYIKLKDAFKENYHFICTDTRRTYHDTTFVIVIIVIAKNYWDH